MKKYITILLFLPFTFCSAQTKQKTADWLNAKSIHRFVAGDVFKSLQDRKFNPDGSFILANSEFEVPFNSLNPKIVSRTTIKGHFRNFSLTSLTVERIGKFVYVTVACSGAARCFSKITVPEIGFDYSDTEVTFGPFDGNEQNIANRLKKAFAHMIALCGGKQEPF